MNKQVSIVEAGNGWIVQVVDPTGMMIGNPLTNLVARNVDEALYLVREALTGRGERQPVPAVFTEAIGFDPVAEPAALAGPTELTLGALFAGMQMIAGMGEAAGECDDPECDCQTHEESGEE